MKPSNQKEVIAQPKDNLDNREKIKLIFDTPYGYHRQLLAGVDSLATNGLDIGYDAKLIEANKEDLYWVVDSEKLIIQAVNNFGNNQKLALGAKIYQQGIATFRIDTLENISNNLVNIQSFVIITKIWLNYLNYDVGHMHKMVTGKLSRHCQ